MKCRWDDSRAGVGLGGWTFLILAMAWTAASGCAGSSNDYPVPDSTMVRVLAELHLAVARAEITGEIPPNIRDSILVAYGIDSASYAQTIVYYADHPEKYEAVYTRVLDQLNSARMPPGAIDTNAPPTPPPSP